MNQKNHVDSPLKEKLYSLHGVKDVHLRASVKSFPGKIAPRFTAAEILFATEMNVARRNLSGNPQASVYTV